MRPSIDDDYYSKPTFYTPESHNLVETADGSIYFATSGIPATPNIGSIERLYRLDANGKVQFARVYKLDGSVGALRPVQLINAGDDQLLMADQVFDGSPIPVNAAPTFALLSLNGDVRVSRGRPYDAGGVWNSYLNQVNWYDGKLYFSTAGNYEFNTYVLDGSLNLKSATKTVGTQGNNTYRGGVSLFDTKDRALYYLLNFGGVSGGNNGFAVVRCDAVGKPCTDTYSPPTTLLLENTHWTVTDDKIDTIQYGPAVKFTPITWTFSQVQVLKTESVCGQ
ncbi:MAG TPA: hypothetical protein VI233_09885 [Puia sp.]